MIMRPGPAAGLLCLYLTLPAAGLHAQETDSAKEEAKKSFLVGVDHFAVENYPAALSAFEKSYEILPNPNVLYNIGMCQRALFDFAASIHTLREYLEKKGEGVPGDEREQIEKILADMEKSVGFLEILVNEDGAAVTIDAGTAGLSPLPGPVMLNPGEHVVEVEKDGFIARKQTVTLKGGGKETLEIELEPVPEAAPPEVVIEPEAAKKDEKKKKRQKILRSPILWGVLGAVIVGGAVAAGVTAWKLKPGPMDDGDWIIRGK
jgi:tetratricopeptide (TPR) repeat protein